LQSRIFFDIHTHTTYSHGKGSIADNAAAASAAGLERLGISDHGPGSFSYGIDMRRIPDMRRDIEACREKYPDLKIELGVEANIINPDGSLDIGKEAQKLFDYIIAGYHYSYLGKKPLKGIAVVVGGWLFRKGITSAQHARNYNTDFMVNTILANKIDIVSHPGDKLAFDIDAIARACEQTDTIMEINDRHHCLTVDGIKTAMKYDVRFILSSDAHTSAAVGNVEKAWERAIQAELDLSRIINLRKEQ
jgi:putative hydrolase